MINQSKAQFATTTTKQLRYYISCLIIITLALSITVWYTIPVTYSDSQTLNGNQPEQIKSIAKHLANAGKSKWSLKTVMIKDALNDAITNQDDLQSKHDNAIKNQTKISLQIKIQDMNLNPVYRQYIQSQVKVSLPHVPDAAVLKLSPLEKNKIIKALDTIESTIIYKNRPAALISFSGEQNNTATTQANLRKRVEELSEILIHQQIPLRWEQYQNYLKFELAQTETLLVQLETEQSKNRNILYRLRKQYQEAVNISDHQDLQRSITSHITPNIKLTKYTAFKALSPAINKCPTSKHFILWSCIIAAFICSSLFLLLNTKNGHYVATATTETTNSKQMPTQGLQASVTNIVYNVNAPCGEFDALIPLIKRINALKTTPTPSNIHLVSITNESIAPRLITSLAIALSQRKQRVLIVEVDHHQRLAKELFAAEGKPGATQWLSTSASISDYLIGTQLEHVQFLPLGITEPDSVHSVLPHHNEMLTKQFDTILTYAPHAFNLENKSLSINWMNTVDNTSEVWLISDEVISCKDMTYTPYDCVIQTIYS
jgi:hypothetical protein